MTRNTGFEMTEEKDNVANNNEIVVDVRQETPDEASKLSNLAKATFAEFLGTVIYVFLATNTQYYSISPALVLVGLIIIFRNISGAHFNPVITLAVRMSGNMEGSKAMILYSGFQLLGGMVGAALSRIVLPHDNYMAHNGGATTLSNTVEVPSAIACEAIITFVLVLTYLMSTLNKSNTHSVISPVAIGFVAWANIEAVGRITGASMNPVRSFGPALCIYVFNENVWQYHYVYWAGPYSGAILAALVYRFILRDK